MANNVAQTINLVNLDFATNKAAFINDLTQQARFKDYDFSGSDVSVLLDILALNFYRHAFYTNMDISEGFLDSAQLPNNVKSHAKELNYLPRSITSAAANVTVTFQATGESAPYIIPKGSLFSSSTKNQNFLFSTAENIICASTNTSFSFTTYIYEGQYQKDSYIYNGTLVANARPTFILSNPRADISSLVVNVIQNNNPTGLVFNLATSLLDLDANSQVYFLQCDAVTGNYEVLFGDGILGQQPQNQSTIVLDYRVCSGANANNCNLFQISFDPTGAGEILQSPTTTTNVVATGGAAAESIETTRFNAPRWFQVQERCIVPSDYELVLKQQFPEIIAVNAYGGETLNPPQYGRIVIAAAIAGVAGGLPISKVNQYTQFIKKRNPISIQPIFVPPIFMFIGVTSLIKYNINVTTDSDNLIESIVNLAVSEFNTENLNDFGASFYFSQFVDTIDEADPSIVSNQTTINLYQKLAPSQTANNYSLNYGVPFQANIAPLPLSHGLNVVKTLSSTSFVYKGIVSELEDDGNGTVRIVNVVGNTFITAANVGKVDYVNGLVNLTNFSVDSFDGSNLLIYVVPQSEDITSSQNTILNIESNQLNLTIQQLSL